MTASVLSRSTLLMYFSMEPYHSRDPESWDKKYDRRVVAYSGISQSGQHGSAFVDALIDCFTGGLADFAAGELAQVDNAVTF